MAGLGQVHGSPLLGLHSLQSPNHHAYDKPMTQMTHPHVYESLRLFKFAGHAPALPLNPLSSPHHKDTAFPALVSAAGNFLPGCTRRFQCKLHYIGGLCSFTASGFPGQ